MFEWHGIAAHTPLGRYEAFGKEGGLLDLRKASWTWSRHCPAHRGHRYRSSSSINTPDAELEQNMDVTDLKY